MNELALFAGAGGGILGGKLLGWRTVCAVEWEPYPASVLCQRQNDGILAPFPVWDDVRTFDGRPWRGIVDVVSGGFPCQDISAAGKGAGIEGERSGMWKEMARIIGEVRPSYAFVENSPMLTTRGLGTVLADLAALGFDAEWGVLSAADVGAPHLRERIWIVAHAWGERMHGRSGECRRPEGARTCREPVGSSQYANDVAHDTEFGRREGRTRRFDTGDQKESELALSAFADTEVERCGEARRFRYNQSEERTASGGEDMADTNSQGLQGTEWPRRNDAQGWQESDGSIAECNRDHWTTEPDVGRVAHGVAARVDRLKAIGNGQVPQCAAEAFRQLYERLME